MVGRPGGPPDTVDSIFGSAADGPSDGGDGGAPKHTVTFYRNGFIVDDGPLRAMDDPANKAFLDAMAAGRVPREFGPGDASIGVADKRGEDFVPPPPPAYVAFSGDGQKLSAAKPASEGIVCAFPGAGSDFHLDESLPTVRVQVQLHTGARKVAKFNLTHTVHDLQQFVARETPGATFTLNAGFPPKVLADPSLTLTEAGVANASVTQRLV